MRAMEARHILVLLQCPRRNSSHLQRCSRCSQTAPAPLIATRTLTSIGSSGCAGPLPLRSMYFFRSVLRYSNTRYRQGLLFSSRCSTHSSLQRARRRRVHRIRAPQPWTAWDPH